MRTTDAGTHYPIQLDLLPASWAAQYIGEVIEDIQSGFPSGEHNKEGRGIPHLRPMNISREGQLDLSDVKYVSAEADELRVEFEDVLFNNTNSPELIGKTTVISTLGDMAFSNHMTRLRPPSGVRSRFIAYQLHYLWMCGYFRHRCTNHVNQASISSSTLAASVPLVVAPTHEQDRIVAEVEKQFTRLDSAVAGLKRVQSNLKRYRASVLKAACEGRLVPTEAELARKENRNYEPASELLKRILVERRAKWEADQLAKMGAAGKTPSSDEWKKKYKEPASPNKNNLPKLPEGSTWASVEQLSSKVVDGVHKKPNYVPNGVPFVTVRNLTAGPGISFEKLKYITSEDHAEFTKRANPNRGDILVSKDGTLGVIRAVRSDQLFSIFVSVAMIKPAIHGMTDYLELALSSPQVQIQMVPKGSGLQHIHLEDLRQDCVPIPPIFEQQRILSAAQRQLSVADVLERDLTERVAHTTSLRHSILRSAFEGKLVAQDSNDEPASAVLDRIRAQQQINGNKLHARGLKLQSLSIAKAR